MTNEYLNTANIQSMMGQIKKLQTDLNIERARIDALCKREIDEYPIQL